MLMTPIPSAVFLVIPFVSTLLADECLTSGFYGSFNGQSLFKINQSCMDAIPAGLKSGTIIPAFQPVQRLVWIQEQAIDESLRSRENTSSVSALDQLFSRLSTLETSSPNSRVYGEQRVLMDSESGKNYDILYRTPSSVLLSLNLDAAMTIDTILPPFYKSILLPTVPVSYVPVPKEKVDAVKDILSSLRFDPTVASIVGAISISQMERDIRYLTGEDEESPIVSRHSFAAGSRTAAAWLQERFEETGANCELKDFLAGFAPNVIWCEY